MLRAARMLLVALTLLAGCDSASSGLDGKYTAQGQDGKPMTLLLKTDFTGSWETATDAVALRWEVKDDELWLHAKSGGLLRGRIDGRILHVALPGEGEFTFRRE